jgi:hypothetical protein
MPPRGTRGLGTKRAGQDQFESSGVPRKTGQKSKEFALRWIESPWLSWRLKKFDFEREHHGPALCVRQPESPGGHRSVSYDLTLPYDNTVYAASVWLLSRNGPR